MFTISDTLLKAISWTLVHTIWQGFILAFLAGMVILATKKATSLVRYNLLSGLFLIFMVVVGCTFNYEYQSQYRANLASNDFSENLKSVFSIEYGSVSNNFSALVIDFLNANANVIVLIWFIIFCIKCFNITSKLSHIYRIRNYRNQPVSEYWNIKLKELSQTIQLHKKVILLESQLVKIPSVTGFFKPMILLPIGLLSQLPQDQVEAILLHELAHIRRKDYVVNMLQSFAEIVFFFNPGVLWLSSLIKEERENCCDDIAVSVTKCKTKFVHALVSFQEYNMKNNELIMGFGGKKNHLLNRAKRIIHNDTKSLNGLEKTFLSIAVFAVIMVMIACNNIPVSEAKALAVVPKSEYCDIISQEIGPMTESQAKDKEAMIQEQKLNLEKVKEQLNDKKKNKNQLEIEADKSKEEKVTNLKSNQPVCKTTTTYETTAVTTVDNREQITEKITINSDKEVESPEQLTDAIIKDLKINKIISGKINLSYNLSQDKLIVNGVVQPDSVHLKFKKKYLLKILKNHPVSANISIVYNFDFSTLVACN